MFESQQDREETRKRTNKKKDEAEIKGCGGIAAPGVKPAGGLIRDRIQRLLTEPKFMSPRRLRGRQRERERELGGRRKNPPLHSHTAEADGAVEATRSQHQSAGSLSVT